MSGIVRRKLLLAAPPSEDTDIISYLAAKNGLEVQHAYSTSEFRKQLVPYEPSHAAIDLSLADAPWFEMIYWISEVRMPPKLLLVADNTDYLSMAAKLTVSWRLPLLATLPKPPPVSELQKVLAL